MSETDNTKALQEMYQALESKDHRSAVAAYADDIQFHIVRSMPMQTHDGKAELAAYIKRVSDVTPLDGEIELEHLAGDGDVVFTQHVEARGTAREHRHVMVWRFEAGKVQEVWELTLGGPPSLQGVNVEALEKAGYVALVMEP